MRTPHEIDDDIARAILASDHAALFALADEMATLGTRQAELSAARTRARAYRLSGALPEALEEFRKLLPLYEEANDRVGMASATLGIGIVYYLLGSYDEALISFNRSLELNSELGLQVGVSAALGNIGSIYHTIGSYPEALDAHMRSLDIHISTNDTAGLASDHSNIGILYHAIGSHAIALEHLEKALTMFQDIGDLDAVARTHHNLASIYQDLEQLDVSEQHFQRSIQLNTEAGYAAGLSFVTANYVNFLLGKGDITTASTLHAQHANMLLSVPTVHAIHFQNKARILELEGDLHGAEEALQEALRITHTAGVRDAEAKVLLQLRELAFQRNDLKGYVEYNNEHTRIIDEINGKGTAAKIAIREAEQRISIERQEHQKHLAVLHSTLPKHIADRVARGEQVNDHYDTAAVIFLDIVGFTTLSDKLSSGEVIQLLDTIFTELDAICKKHEVVKIKTIGDSYMAVAFPSESSSSEQQTARVVERAAHTALEMLNAVSKIMIPNGSPEGSPERSHVSVRIGVHCGAVTAGVLGKERLQYDVWGDTVNVASRMESTGEPGRIHVSDAFVAMLTSPPSHLDHSNTSPPNPLDHSNTSPPSHLDHSNTSPPNPLSSLRGGTSLTPLELERGGAEGAGVRYQANGGAEVRFQITLRGETELKGKGVMTTYWLEPGLPPNF